MTIKVRSRFQGRIVMSDADYNENMGVIDLTIQVWAVRGESPAANGKTFVRTHADKKLVQISTPAELARAVEDKPPRKALRVVFRQGAVKKPSAHGSRVRFVVNGDARPVFVQYVPGMDIGSFEELLWQGRPETTRLDGMTLFTRKYQDKKLHPLTTAAELAAAFADVPAGKPLRVLVGSIKGPRDRMTKSVSSEQAKKPRNFGDTPEVRVSAVVFGTKQETAKLPAQDDPLRFFDAVYAHYEVPVEAKKFVRLHSDRTLLSLDTAENKLRALADNPENKALCFVVKRPGSPKGPQIRVIRRQGEKQTTEMMKLQDADLTLETLKKTIGGMGELRLFSRTHGDGKVVPIKSGDDLKNAFLTGPQDKPLRIVVRSPREAQEDNF